MTAMKEKEKFWKIVTILFDEQGKAKCGYSMTMRKNGSTFGRTKK